MSSLIFESVPKMRHILGLLILIVLAASGCGKAGRVPTYPVHGQILYDGKPAAGVMVFFYPTGAPGVPEIPGNPHGETGPDGRFTLTTYKDGDGAAEGTPLPGAGLASK
jgi:hypothetical protein